MPDPLLVFIISSTHFYVVCYQINVQFWQVKWCFKSSNIQLHKYRNHFQHFVDSYGIYRNTSTKVLSRLFPGFSIQNTTYSKYYGVPSSYEKGEFCFHNTQAHTWFPLFNFLKVLSQFLSQRTEFMSLSLKKYHLKLNYRQYYGIYICVCIYV